MVKDTDISLGDLADNALLVLFANGSKPAAMELTRRLGPSVSPCLLSIAKQIRCRRYRARGVFAIVENRA